MYHDLIILVQSIQHSSGSSPLPHLHTSCFHLIWFMFPYFFLHLPSSSPLLFCYACPLLLPCLPSGLSLPSVPRQDAFSPTSLAILNLHISAFLPPSLPALPPNSLAPPHGYTSSQFPFSAPPITRSPLSLPAGYCSVSQGPNSCIPFAGSLCELPLHCCPLWDP